MASINVTDEVDYDRKRVYEGFRDNLRDLIPFLPDIEDIVVKSHERTDDDTVEVVNLWKADQSEVGIPTLAQKFIKPEMLEWTDYATWHDDTWSCDWKMEVGFLKDAVDCSGTTRYIDKNGGTEIVIEGELSVDASEIPGVPRLVAGKVGSAVEKFVVKLITPNLTDVNRGMEKYLAEQDD